MTLWVYGHDKKGFFLNGIKVNIYAYANMIIEYYDFSNDFWNSRDKVIKIQEKWKILILNLIQTIIFLVPKVLRYIFYP